MNENNNGSSTLFKDFLHEVATNTYATNTTSTGTVTIQQSARNELRKRGLEALISDLKALWGDDFDILETKEGIVIAVENEPGGFTFSWELKSTIKSLDFDPFLEAIAYDEERAQKTAKRLAKAEERSRHEAELEKKRAAKLAELASKKSKLK